MALSVSEISGIARLARLRLEPEEERLFAAQLSRVVDYVDLIARYEDATAAEGPSAARPPITAAPRPDQPGETLDLADFLRNAPAALDRFLVVPQVK